MFRRYSIAAWKWIYRHLNCLMVACLVFPYYMLDPDTTSVGQSLHYSIGAIMIMLFFEITMSLPTSPFVRGISGVSALIAIICYEKIDKFLSLLITNFTV